MKTDPDSPAAPKPLARGVQLGASLIEYVLLLALIALVCISALTYFGGSSSNSIGHSCHQILSAGGGSAAC